MNYITPVTSLPETLVDLLGDVREKLAVQKELIAELNDVSHPIKTVAQRSDGLMNFDGNY